MVVNTKGLSQGTLDEIKRKAASGIAMSAPTAQKQAIYDSLKPKAASPVSPVSSALKPPSALGQPAAPVNVGGINTVLRPPSQPVNPMNNGSGSLGAMQQNKNAFSPANGISNLPLLNTMSPGQPVQMPHTLNTPVQPTLYSNAATTNAPKPTASAPNMDLSLGTLLQIQKKAKSGQAMSEPSAVKSALYDYYKTNPNVKITSGMTGKMLDEIMKKAGEGTSLSAPTGEKNAIYYALKPPTTPGASATPTPTTPGMPEAPKGPIVQGPTDNGQANWNSNQSIPDYGAMTPDMINKLFSGYTDQNPYYDPSKDPVYQSIMSTANTQADKASVASMEEMNERGILNSTVTTDRNAQIRQGASDAVIGAIPGLAANFDNKTANNMAGASNLLNTVMGGAQWQQQFAEGNRQFDKNFTLDEAKISGRYVPAEMQPKITELLELKATNERGGIPPAQVQANADRANAIRRELAAAGIDISGLGGNINAATATQNASNIGRNSLPQQAQDLAKTEVMGRDTSTVAQGHINTILTAKQQNESKSTTAAQRASNTAAANNARAQLASLGFDISKLGGNVTYAQAVKNAGSLGAPTLAAQGQAADIALANKELAFKESSFSQNLAFEKSTFNRTQDHVEKSFDRTQDHVEKSFDRTMKFNETQLYIESDLKQQGLDLNSISVGIDSYTAKSDGEYKKWQQGQGVSEQNAKVATNKAVASVLATKTAAEAFAMIAKYGDGWADNAVDFRKVTDAIESKYPKSTEKLTEESSALGGFAP